MEQCWECFPHMVGLHNLCCHKNKAAWLPIHLIYLRTVRVTAAVYWGFHSKLLTLLLFTFQHRAGVRLYTSCYHLAESCVFSKQSSPSGMCHSPSLSPFVREKRQQKSTPSPEVTESFCRVPSTWFSQAP